MSSRQQRARGVVGLYRAAVEDACAGGDVGASDLGDLGSDDLVGLFGDLWRGGATGADGPDGLVGDDQRGKRSRVDAFERDGDLELEDVGGQVGFALVEVLADADDGDEAVREGGLQLEVDALCRSR